MDFRGVRYHVDIVRGVFATVASAGVPAAIVSRAVRHEITVVRDHDFFGTSSEIARR